MKKKLFSTFKIVLAFGLGFLIVYLSLSGLSDSQKNDISKSFAMANYWWVALSIIIGIISHIIRAERWRMLLKPIGNTPSLKNSFLAVMIGYFANLGIPRSGELARCSILYKEDKIPVDKSFGTVIIERTIDMVIFFSLFFVTFLVEYERIDQYVDANIFPAFESKFGAINTDWFFAKIIGGGIIILAIIYFAFGKRIKKTRIYSKIASILSGIWDGLKSISKIQNPGLFILYSLLIWFMYFLMIYVSLFALPQTSSLGWGAALSALVLGSIGIMLTPGGIGLYPVIIAQTLVLYGLSPNEGYGDAIGWITWSSQTLMIIVVGAISLLFVSVKGSKMQVIESTN